MTFQFKPRWLTSVAMWAAAALVMTISACTQSESEPLSQGESTPLVEQPTAEEVAKPAAEEATAYPAVHQEANQPTATKAAAGQPTTEEPDPFAVPDGSPEELLKYVEGLRSVRPKSNDMAGMMEFRKNIGGALVTTADRVLEQKPTDEQSKEAVFLLLSGLTALEGTGDKDAEARLKGLPAELEKAGLSKFVRVVKSFELYGRLQQAGRAPAEEVKPLIEEVAAFLAEGDIQGEDVNLAMTAAMMAESTGDGAWAGEVCKKIGTLVAKNEDKSIASMGAKLIGAGRRANLVGNKMPLEGVTLEGETLDWSKYEGKVVLVDFWATWCGPCVQEMPNIRQNYDAYHDRGFDVIGISVDQDREALASFLKEHDEPWTVLCDQDLAKSETGEMMGDRYGVFSIPTMALIGTDGKVVVMNPRGPQLGEELEKLLGPAEGKKESPPAAEAKPPAAEAKPAAAEAKPPASEVKPPAAEAKPAAAEAKPAAEKKE